MLQSPDGNWIALQNSQLGRPSLLTKRKSLVFSALEKESGVASAYDDMGSDSETGNDQADWVTALQQFRRRLSDETYYTDSQHDPEWTYSRRPPVTSPSSGRYTNTETLNSDSETSSTPPGHEAPSRHRTSLLGNLKKKPPDPQHHPQQEALDVNLNPRAAGVLGPVDSSEAEDRQGDPVRKARRRKRSRREVAEPTFRNPPVQYSSTASVSWVLKTPTDGSDYVITDTTTGSSVDMITDTPSESPVNMITSIRQSYGYDYRHPHCILYVINVYI